MAKKVKLSKNGQILAVDKSAVDLLTSNGWTVGVAVKTPKEETEEIETPKEEQE